jgi:hypothetical protein
MHLFLKDSEEKLLDTTALCEVAEFEEGNATISLLRCDKRVLNSLNWEGCLKPTPK